MATGRTVDKWARVYYDGYDISGMSRSVGPTGVVYDESDLTTMADTIKGYLPNMGQLNCDIVNGIFDNTATTGLHTVAQSAGIKRTLLVAYGIQAAPATGDPAFGGQFTQGDYRTSSDGGALAASIPFQGWAADATFSHRYRPFGVLLRHNIATTAVNSAVGLDDNLAASSAGGYMTYHVLAGNGTATIKAQDAAVNTDPSFADIAGCTTGSINCAVVQHGIIAATTQTIRQFLRWQIVLGTATTVTFVLAFTRG